MIPVRVEPDSYVVSALPEDDSNYVHYVVTVERRGPGRWAVVWTGFCLGADGDWEWEPSPSSRTDEWKETHRFDLATALELARDAARDVEVNGVHIRDVLGRRATT